MFWSVLNGSKKKAPLELFTPPNACKCWCLVAEQVAIGIRTGLCTRGSTATGAFTAKVGQPFRLEIATRESGEREPCRARACTSSRLKGPGGETSLLLLTVVKVSINRQPLVQSVEGIFC